MSATKGGLVAASLAVSLLLAEMVTRAVAPQLLFGPLGDSLDGLSVLKPKLHTRMAAAGEFDVRVTTNEQRLRARREYDVDPAPGTVRIVAVGDSFTFGWGAGDDETYPARLEAWLREHTGERVEVLNAGVPDTGTGEEVLWYERGPARLHPALVVLGVTSTDPADEAERQLFVRVGDSAEPRPSSGRRRRFDTWRTFAHAAPGFGVLAEHSHLVNLVRKTVSRAARQARPADGSEGAAAVLETWRREFTWFNRRLAAQGVVLVVAFLPEHERVYRDGRFGAPYTEPMLRHLRAECDAQAIPFLDPTDSMQRRAERGLALFFPHDPHPTPAGYDALAAEVGAFLVQRGFMKPRNGRSTTGHRRRKRA